MKFTKKNPPKVKDYLNVLKVFNYLDNETRKLLSKDELTALYVVSNAIVALSDPNNLFKYKNIEHDRKVKVKIYE